MGLRRWVRVLVVGRRDGVRARVRRKVGVCTWLDERGRSSQAPTPRRTEPVAPEVDPPEPQVPEGWVRILDRSEIAPGEVIEVFVDERAIVVAEVDGVLTAIDSVCPHAGGPLADGQLEGNLLTCPWHGWAFDVCTGRCEVSDDIQLQTFTLREEGDGVFIELPSSP